MRTDATWLLGTLKCILNVTLFGLNSHEDTTLLSAPKQGNIFYFFPNCDISSTRVFHFKVVFKEVCTTGRCVTPVCVKASQERPGNKTLLTTVLFFMDC